MNNCTSTAWILINSTRFERGRSQFSLALISAASLIARREMGQVPLCSPLAAEKQLSFSQEEEEEEAGRVFCLLCSPQQIRIFLE